MEIEETVKYDKKKKEKKEKEDIPFGRVFMLNKPEWYFILLGCLFSIISGAVQPAFSVILAQATGVCLLHLSIFSF